MAAVVRAGQVPGLLLGFMWITDRFGDLYYRLNRIEQICGLSLREGRDRLLAHLALRLHRLYSPPPRKVLGFPTVGRFGAR